MIPALGGMLSTVAAGMGYQADPLSPAQGPRVQRGMNIQGRQITLPNRVNLVYPFPVAAILNQESQQWDRVPEQSTTTTTRSIS